VGSNISGTFSVSLALRARLTLNGLNVASV
jgi:hypothetical protein